MRVAFFTSIIAASSAVTVYNPPTAGVALDAVEKALAKVVNNPHLSKLQLSQAKKVVADVEKTAEELDSEAGKKLSQEARAAKVTASIKELQDLQADWEKASQSALSAKKMDLEKQLEAKEKELISDKKMLKVVNLEKALAEKKLKLQKLLSMKNAQESSQAAQKEAAAKQQMVASVLNAAKSLTVTKSSGKTAAADKLKTVMSYLEGRMHDVTAALAKLDASEKKKEGELKAIVDKKEPVKDDKDPLAKGQGVLKMLLKKEHRQYEKTRATLQIEQKELHQAIESIKKGDAGSLTKVMTKMQGEMKSLEAKSHKFLY